MKRLKKLGWWQISILSLLLFFVISIIFNALIDAFPYITHDPNSLPFDSFYHIFFELFFDFVAVVIVTIFLQLFYSKIKIKTYILFLSLATAFVLLYPYITLIATINIYNEVAYTEATILCGHKPYIASNFIEKSIIGPENAQDSRLKLFDTAYFCTQADAREAGY